MNYILFDGFRRQNLLPLTYLRPVADIRIGILTIREKWERFLGAKTSALTEEYLRKKYPIIEESDNIMINGSVCPSPGLVAEIKGLKPGESLYKGEVIIALRVKSVELERIDEDVDDVSMINSSADFIKVTNPWDIFRLNGRAIEDDFRLVTKGRKSRPFSTTNRLVGDKIFIEEGARVECAMINAESGPVYIGRNSEIMEGAMIRGPFALGEGATVKMGAKIYGPTTIGPHCKAGGEINNSVMFGYSNKAHDGFMGQSVIGEWCNIGADTNTSNLKNNYGDVKLWSISDQTFVETGLQFCGLILGDHSKCGINVMFNTGTVVGICSNIYGVGYQRNYIPSFTSGGTMGLRPAPVKDVLEVAHRVLQRRDMKLDPLDEEIIQAVYARLTERLS